MDGSCVSGQAHNINNGKTVTLPEDNTGLEFVPTYIHDTVRVFVKAMEEKLERVYNVDSPHIVDFETLITKLGNAVGKEPIIERVIADKPTPIVLNLEKIGTMVDLDAFVTHKYGLAKTVAEQHLNDSAPKSLRTPIRYPP